MRTSFVKAPKEKHGHSEIHLVRIYLLMASCRAMPRLPPSACCQEHLPYCHINLDMMGRSMEKYMNVASSIVCNRAAIIWGARVLKRAELRPPCKWIARFTLLMGSLCNKPFPSSPRRRCFSPLSPLFVRIVCRRRRNSAVRASGNGFLQHPSRRTCGFYSAVFTCPWPKIVLAASPPHPCRMTRYHDSVVRYQAAPSWVQ